MTLPMIYIKYDMQSNKVIEMYISSFMSSLGNYFTLVNFEIKKPFEFSKFVFLFYMH